MYFFVCFSGEKLLESLKEFSELVLLIAKKSGTCADNKEYRVIHLLFFILLWVLTWTDFIMADKCELWHKSWVFPCIYLLQFIHVYHHKFPSITGSLQTHQMTSSLLAWYLNIKGRLGEQNFGVLGSNSKVWIVQSPFNFYLSLWYCSKVGDYLHAIC